MPRFLIEVSILDLPRESELTIDDYFDPSNRWRWEYDQGGCIILDATDMKDVHAFLEASFSHPAEELRPFKYGGNWLLEAPLLQACVVSPNHRAHTIEMRIPPPDSEGWKLDFTSNGVYWASPADGDDDPDEEHSDDEDNQSGPDIWYKVASTGSPDGEPARTPEKAWHSYARKDPNKRATEKALFAATTKQAAEWAKIDYDRGTAPDGGKYWKIHIH